MWTIRAETDHLQSLAMVAPVEPIQDWHFLTTRRTPGCPEAYDYYLAAYRAQIECCTIQFLDHQRWGRLTNLHSRERA